MGYFSSSSFPPPPNGEFLQTGEWRLTHASSETCKVTASFPTAAYAVPQCNVTPSEQSAIRPLPHTCVHRCSVIGYQNNFHFCISGSTLIDRFVLTAVHALDLLCVTTCRLAVPCELGNLAGIPQLAQSISKTFVNSAGIFSRNWFTQAFALLNDR